MRKTIPSPESSSYSINPGPNQQLRNYRVHANIETAALRTEEFRCDLKTWLGKNYLFRTELIFVRNNLAESELTGDDEISIKLYPGMMHARLCHPQAYDQVAVLTQKGNKLVAAIFKAIENLHTRGEHHYGGLTCINSYAVREVSTIYSKNNKKIEIEVLLVPGHYEFTVGIEERNRRPENSYWLFKDGFHSSRENQQELDVFQLNKFLFETLLKVLESDYFSNYQVQVTSPRLHKSFLSLENCFDTCPTIASDDWNTKTKGQFYNHYAILDSRARLAALNDLFDNYDTSSGLRSNKSSVNWKEIILDKSFLQNFYDEPVNASLDAFEQRSRHYGDDIFGLLKFLKHVFTHIKEKVVEFQNPDYLELVLADAFHDQYGKFF